MIGKSNLVASAGANTEQLKLKILFAFTIV